MREEKLIQTMRYKKIFPAVTRHFLFPTLTSNSLPAKTYVFMNVLLKKNICILLFRPIYTIFLLQIG